MPLSRDEYLRSEPQKRLDLETRVEKTLRTFALTATLSVGVVGILALFADGSWTVVGLALLAVCLIVWVAAAALAPRIVRDLLELKELTVLRNLSATIQKFNSGDTTARVRLVGPGEVRELSQRFNLMAGKTAEALEKVRVEVGRDSQFIADVSHELQTPLTSISGAAETLLEGDLEPEDQARFLNMIITDSARLSRLANDLINLQRIEGGTGEIPLRRFELTQAIERASAGLEPIIESRCLDFSYSGAAPEVLGDIDRIQQVVVNLVANAAQVLDEGGRIWIEIEPVARRSLGPLLYERGLAETETYAKMSINDNGPGIPADTIERLFDRFYRPAYGRGRKSGGSGLGLSIVKAIVTAHGGVVAACNRDDGGAQFSVYLPIPPAADTAPPPRPTRPLAHQGSGRVRLLPRKPAG